MVMVPLPLVTVTFEPAVSEFRANPVPVPMRSWPLAADAVFKPVPPLALATGVMRLNWLPDRFRPVPAE